MAEQKTKMQYVRLGNSGLKVSRIILGTMQYGDKRWQEWVLEEDEAIKHIQYACVLRRSLLPCDLLADVCVYVRQLRARHQHVRHGRRLLERPLREDPRQRG
ncbi:hypothetical protein NM688_g9055 [Phlebia brevispora]|uniref:Uncharacterized protein n=1 Tax=Phlebia brevispora TaxID=194682 RepID=A0ACC1RMI5_9APHY|nr:hypothetical protein NM688_g9055 [Phlebia brevispora]